MYEIWIHLKNNEWKLIHKSDSFIEAEDVLLETYIHRSANFISVAIYDQFDNRHMYIDRTGEIDQTCRVKWHDEPRDGSFKPQIIGG